MKSKPHIAVVGAGAFGGWTALHLLERGARVTLLDAWGPGNSRASSGGETRIMRGTYGPDQPYTETRRARPQAVGRNMNGAGRNSFSIAPAFFGWSAAATTLTNVARSKCFAKPGSSFRSSPRRR